jgi:cytochrome P450
VVQHAQDLLRQEIISVRADQFEYISLQKLPYLTSVIYETLRLYPPISQLINRRTTQSIVLGGKIPIPADTFIGYNAYSTGRDLEAWGDDADDFRPERWGSSIEEINTHYRRSNSRAEFIAFHGGRRACLGQKFAMFEARLTMAVLVTSLKWIIDPAWTRRMTPVSPQEILLMTLLLMSSRPDRCIQNFSVLNLRDCRASHDRGVEER